MKLTLIRLLTASLAAMAIVCPRQATAESPARPSSDTTKAVIDMAEALFERAMAFMGEGNFAAAAELFEESLRLDPAMGTEFHLAECHEHMGRLALAWSRFTAVAELAKQQGSLEREEMARGRARALEGRIGRVTIRVPARVSAIPALALALDNRQLAAARWVSGASLVEVVDPGGHTVEATAPGKERWRHTFEVKAGTTVGVTVDAFPVRAPERPAARIQPALVIGGSLISAAALGTGIGLFVHAAAAKETYTDGVRWLTNGRGTAQSACGRNTPFVRECDSVTDSRMTWKRSEQGAIVAFVSGGAFAAGTIAYSLWPRKTLATPPVELGSGIGPEGGRFFVRGRF